MFDSAKENKQPVSLRDFLHSGRLNKLENVEGEDNVSYVSYY